MMSKLLKLEEAAMFIAALLFFGGFGLPWWLFALLLLTPDFGALGYLGGPRLGSVTYNLLHHKGVAIALWFIGWWTQSQSLAAAGVIIFAHSSLDRVLGFGLKYPDSFQNTHLGKIGRNK